MSDLDGTVLVGDSNVGRRKRIHTGGARQKAKEARYAKAKTTLVFHPCQHNTDKFACYKFRPRDVKIFNSNFYKFPDKIRQDSIISTLVQTSDIKRRRSRPVASNKSQKPGTQHEYNVKYFLPTLQFGKIPVCKKFFLSIASGIGRTRLSNIVKKVSSSEPIEEKRGGDRKSNFTVLKKEKVREFIRSLKGTESHYNRSKSKRIYLSAELSISKLWYMYNQQATEDTKVSGAMFRRIFNTEFNCGFRSPASDACSTCILLKERIKNAPLGSAEKQRYMVEKRIHSKRAKAFYEHMKQEVPDSISLCFDLQQIQPLPKTPVQEAFYARQLNLYIFCVTDLKTANPTFYTWTEDQAGKGSQEISSALLNHLKLMDFKGNSTLRLFCDGCTSQNKNNIVLRSLVHFVETTRTTITKVILFFPVRGHSFLPADRVFGRAEKILRKKAIILSRDEYFDCYKEIGSVKYLGNDWNLINTKDLNKFYKDIDGISQVKRIIIKVKEEGDEILKIARGREVVTTIPAQRLENKKYAIVKGLKNYRFEDCNNHFVSLRKKRNIDYCTIELDNVALGHPISQEKKNDVQKLLIKMFGENWPDDQPLDERLQWYKEIIFNHPAGIVEDNPEECDCLDNELCDLHI